MTFDVNRLAKIILEVSRQFRKGAEMTSEDRGSIKVTHMYMMPHTSEAPTGLEVVDMWFIDVGVDKAKAEAHRAEIVAILEQWSGQPLKGGLSYISFGATLGSQDLALNLMAIGKVLGFWNVVTPLILGMKSGDPKAEEMAGMGFVMASGYQPNLIGGPNVFFAGEATTTGKED